MSLALWVFCPNILAHARLITSDAVLDGDGRRRDVSCSGDISEQPTWRWAAVAGVAAGHRAAVEVQHAAAVRGLAVPLAAASWGWSSPVVNVAPSIVAAWASIQGIAIVALSVLTIDVGYLFEGVGIRWAISSSARER